MVFESFKEIYKSDEGATLRAGGKAWSVEASFAPKENKNYRLFTVGETEQFYLWKNPIIELCMPRQKLQKWVSGFPVIIFLFVLQMG